MDDEGTLHAHPILTGSVFPIRSVEPPTICDPAGEIYHLISDEALPSGLIARLLMMTAATRMIENGTNSATWNNISSLLNDMMVARSGSSNMFIRRTLRAFSAATISTPHGNLHLTPLTDDGRKITLIADPPLLDVISSEGVLAENRIIQLLRGKGPGGVSTDLYLWLLSMRDTPMDRLFTWPELRTITALSGIRNFPMRFTKSVYEVSSVYREVDVIPLVDGIRIRTGKYRKEGV